MNVVRQGHSGWIEVITGSMFSGKSEELIRRIRRAQIARQKVQVFKPQIDNRYGENHVVSHSEMKVESIDAKTSAELLAAIKPATEVIGIDEGQFFDEGIVDACNTLAEQGKRVIVAGLDMNYLGEPFNPMPKLLAIAEFIDKTHAICMQCGNPANFTQRLFVSADLVVVGAKGMYEARCRRCFDPSIAIPK